MNDHAKMKPGLLGRLKFLPLGPERWPDVENLFGPRGACGGCWCMFWRLSRAEFEKEKGAGNKKALKAIVESGEMPGLIAYADGKPVGWCALAPRERYSRLLKSRALKPVDDKPVWSIVCFFVAKTYRRRGLSVELLSAAVQYAKSQGASIVEAYPVEPKKGHMPDVFAWTGLAAAFRRAGFTEVLRRAETRPIMRFFTTRGV